MARRALHYVFKIGDRNSTIKFYREILGMKVLRHEEFEDGCKATCNGPYDGKWSKTMIGYGDEDSHFVLELTYNYGVMNYTKGNDFVSITINSRNAIDNVKKYNWPIIRENGDVIVESPGGYQFVLKPNHSNGLDPVDRVTLASSNLQNSLNYWHDLLGMKIYYKDDKSVLLGYHEQQCKLELVDIGKPVDHAKAFGRIAFSCPTKELPEIEDRIKNANQTILTPLVSLDTPGKATVQVVILADPDGDEICFVGDEAFRQLSAFDPEGDKLLNEAISKDKSDEWFEKKGISKDII